METYIATGEVTALKHELRDHTMELGPVVAKALFASAKGTEVFSGLGGDIIVKIEIDTASLVCHEINHGSEAVRAAALKDFHALASSGVGVLSHL